MHWARKGFVHCLAVLLFISLLGVAFTISALYTFTPPAKVEKTLAQSKLYDHFVSNAINEAEKSSNSSDSSGSVSLNDVAVQEAAKSAFSPQLIQKSVETFVNSNYAWLKGKTATPSFTIDLTSAKQSFAEQVGRYAETRLNTLPICSAAQLSQIDPQNIDPLAIACRPAGLDPQAENSRVMQEITTSSDFLSNPIITANTINPNNQNAQGQPYYQKLSHAPKLYRLGVTLPWVFGVLTLLSAAGVFYLAATKRRGTRRIAIALALAGCILVATKFVADTVFNHLEKRLFNNSSVGQLQQSLTNFLHRLESQLVKIDLWFGVAFLILAAAAVIYLLATRRSGTTPAQPNAPFPTDPQPEQTLRSETSQQAEQPQPPRPKRPRLVQ
ncbi:MAG: hypothetical protein WA843_04735 [Candidatus Saccharimonadales bacterium]